MAWLNIELTFKAGYYFDCTNCGICCQYLGGISITRREHEKFAKMLPRTEFFPVKHSAFPYLLTNNAQCRYLRNSKCVIHGSHPLFCRLYPLSFGSHLNNAYVNLIHCEGVNTKGIGDEVNLSYTQRTFEEMRKLEGEEFPSTFLSEEGLLTRVRMALCSIDSRTVYSDFGRRRRLLLNIADWVTDSSFGRDHIGSWRLRAILLGPISFLKNELQRAAKPENEITQNNKEKSTDMEGALDDVSSDRLFSHLSEGSFRLLEQEKKTPDKFKISDPFSKSSRIIDSNGEIQLYDYYDKPVTMPTRLAFARPNLEKDALDLELSYIQEILQRVGMGGIPHYVPIDSGVERLSSVIQGMEIYSNYLAFRDGKGSIDSELMTDSIRNTDTRIMDLLVV